MHASNESRPTNLGQNKMFLKGFGNYCLAYPMLIQSKATNKNLHSYLDYLRVIISISQYHHSENSSNFLDFSGQ